MTKFNCPSCGAENSFKSVDSLFAVCPYCKASIFKSAEQLQLLGKVSEIAEDNSPLQLRATGTYNGKSFSVIGRVRMKWEDGFWNEWQLFFNDGSSGTLSEAQGEFTLLREIQNAFPLPVAKWTLQNEVTVEQKNYSIVDLKNSEVQMSEGELPFRAVPGDKRFSADFRGHSGSQLGSLEQDRKTPEDLRVYLGEVIELSDLKMSYLRTFDGW